MPYVIGWVLSHPKRDAAFPGWSEKQIVMNLLNYNRDEGMLAVTDPNGYLVGVLTFNESHPEKTIHIQSILLNSHKAFCALLECWDAKLPGYDLLANRPNGKLVRYKRKQFNRFHNPEQPKQEKETAHANT